MNFIKLLPVLLSALLMAAHFLRMGSLILVVVSLALPLLLLLRKRWAVRAVQICLIIATLEWFRTLYVIARQRIDMSMPWTRLAVILGGVAVFTGLSACVFFMKSLKIRYKLFKEPSQEN
ncbi:MAG: hypothetical protein ACYSSP_11545 [Planctomycetota bacterium]|jgi:hypothetical protein